MENDLMNARTAVEAGRRAASERSVIGWGVFGWAFALAAIPMVYLRSPKMPAAVAEKIEDGTNPALFESGYVDYLKTRQARSAWIGFTCAIVMYALLSFVGSGGSSSSGGGAIQRAVESARIITAAEFSRLQDGMTYEQAVLIVGAEGEELSRSSLAGITTVMYSWINDDFSNANAMFQDGRLISKAQFGL